MTTNARDEKWSSWIDWSGGTCPVFADTFVQWKGREANQNGSASIQAGNLYWEHKDYAMDIIAYRYKIEEPESDMHPDLEWLATACDDMKGALYISREDDGFSLTSKPYNHAGSYHHNTWLQARKDLGLIMSDEEEEIAAEEQPRRNLYEEIKEGFDALEASRNQYSAYFKDVRHIDTIDVYRVVSLFDCEKHGHPISHAAKKLLLSGSRTGCKDVEEDVREAIDSLHRWLEMREEDKRAL